jgi:hypothetical protein
LKTFSTGWSITMVYSKCISLLSSPPVRYQASYCLHTLLYGGPTQVGTTPNLLFRAVIREAEWREAGTRRG